MIPQSMSLFARQLSYKASLLSLEASPTEQNKNVWLLNIMGSGLQVLGLASGSVNRSSAHRFNNDSGEPKDDE
jgi:hypothetical protein